MTDSSRSWRALVIAAAISFAAYRSADAAQAFPVEVEWSSSCENDRTTFFVLNIAADGDIEYQGSSGVRSRGSYHAKVSKASARKISNAAKSAVSSDERNRMRDADYVNEDFVEPNTYCLRVTVDGVTTPVVLDSVTGRKLQSAVKKEVNLSRWICPTTRVFGNGEKYCSLPIVSISAPARAHCNISHEFALYSDGTLHYYLSGTDSRDEYLRDVAAAGWKSLIEGLSGEQLVLTSDERGAAASSDGQVATQYYGPDAAELLKRVSSLWSINFKDVPDTRFCPGNGNAFEYAEFSVDSNLK